MSEKRKIIEIDEELCDGCGQCIPACEEGAIQLVNGKAKLVGDKYCDGLGNCLGECPTGALEIVEREAEAFDEEAVQELLESQSSQEKPKCPSARLQQFTPCSLASMPKEQSGSALSHWPVQIKLVPPNAPFLQSADLLVTADCAPVATAEYHSRFLPGKVALIGCPKFDDLQEYLDKFVDILNCREISSITVLSMDVPCCSGLLGVIKKAKEISGSSVAVYSLVLSTDGQVKEEVEIAA
jgi:ferredoxin